MHTSSGARQHGLRASLFRIAGFFHFLFCLPIEACSNTLLLVLYFLHTLLVEIIVLHNFRHLVLVWSLMSLCPLFPCDLCCRLSVPSDVLGESSFPEKTDGPVTNLNPSRNSPLKGPGDFTPLQRLYLPISALNLSNQLPQPHTLLPHLQLLRIQIHNARITATAATIPRWWFYRSCR